jgi:DNA-binding NtrC family response regulator
MLEFLNAKCPATQILFFIQPDQIEMAHRALRAGTFHYAHLPISDEELRLLVETAIERQPQFGPNLLIREEDQRSYFEQMVGRSPAIQSVFRQIRQAAATDIPVLVTGETGTGKELVAHAIHEQSARREGPYVPVHIGALPADLVASELVGHEKGAFTGAINQRIGCFERAQGGTVFLDEVATIDEKMQVSLLRLLETRSFSRMGGQTPISVDVRLIAASNADLMEEVRRGRFREDLFFRLDVLHIHLPALRDRHGDIPLLMDHFIQQVSKSFGKEIRGISPDCVARLENYSWPGNVRELKNVVQRAVVMCDGDILRPEHLPVRLQRSMEAPVAVPVHVGMSLEEVEREMIARTLESTGRNRTRTARILGISRRALYNKIKKYGF